MSTPTSFTFQQIGVVHSCYRQKFGIPRQPGLIEAANGRIELLAPFNRMDVLDGLEGFSHIWVHFIFHQCMQENWKAKIRPPRLGGKTKVGVFASRATHRPNPLGLSVVKLGAIYQEEGRVYIDIIGADLLDQTPVVDIKPYLPYADALPDAKGGFAPLPVEVKPVRFTPQAEQQCHSYLKHTGRDLQSLASQVIGQDPRPSYLWGTTGRIHGNQLWDANVKWVAYDEYFEVTEIELGESHEPAKNA
ncbi:tRNA (N6-threonylcarbamoyladenosine(37)-N6)-methyltransferase TrmO [Maribrevibacterium harenarium]|uniref:tRNA (N6-threonylcarbamoyladenosine(37)-N6)-methyltransferase TrmO n=1 Tax=Maribrevibacterium harenarium TaxID=2589817 RepID=A0A501WKR7_9GAMM|nr:tRNA (N6-threonylcarbamoyladenosine(37)-N6)-methyltransferase TrmO [Maribrevibacterium harenarium]TPE48734.1 tRNA (N6-threonylcarbamoyladenosine(37)-N6)-methyltransferase TrmO [Maribrevibacterium harenarium]